MLATRRRRGAQVDDGCALSQRHETVPQALSDVDRPLVLVIEQDRVPLTVGWRTDADVQDNVQDCSMHAHDVLRLSRRYLGEMHSTQSTGHRGRPVGLVKVEPMTDVLL
jgi:hypothetical protein